MLKIFALCDLTIKKLKFFEKHMIFCNYVLGKFKADS